MGVMLQIQNTGPVDLSPRHAAEKRAEAGVPNKPVVGGVESRGPHHARNWLVGAEPARRYGMCAA